MKIDTLVICGAGTNAPHYVGILYALFENNIIDKDMKHIKEILTASVGIWTSILILLKMDLKVIYKIVMNTSVNKLIDYDNINIDSLINSSGLFNVNDIANVVEVIIYYKTGIKNCTLKQLYEITDVKLNVLCYNITKGYLEVFNHENHPDISIYKLSSMTMAIPIFFKPVLYNKNYYVDGAIDDICDSFYTSKNYLRLEICSNISNNMPMILKTIMAIIRRKRKKIKNKREIYVQCNTGIIDFDMSENDKKNMIVRGYNRTMKHLEDYDLLSRD